MRGNITKTVKRIKIRGLFYDIEEKKEVEKNAFIYTDVTAESISMVEAMSQHPGLIEIKEELRTDFVVIGMSMDRFLLFREMEKVKKNKKETPHVVG